MGNLRKLQKKVRNQSAKRPDTQRVRPQTNPDVHFSQPRTSSASSNTISATNLVSRSAKFLGKIAFNKTSLLVGAGALAGYAMPTLGSIAKIKLIEFSASAIATTMPVMKTAALTLLSAPVTPVAIGTGIAVALVAAGTYIGLRALARKIGKPNLKKPALPKITFSMPRFSVTRRGAFASLAAGLALAAITTVATMPERVTGALESAGTSLFSSVTNLAQMAKETKLPEVSLVPEIEIEAKNELASAAPAPTSTEAPKTETIPATPDYLTGKLNTAAPSSATATGWNGFMDPKIVTPYAAGAYEPILAKAKTETPARVLVDVPSTFEKVITKTNFNALSPDLQALAKRISPSMPKLRAAYKKLECKKVEKTSKSYLAFLQGAAHQLGKIGTKEARADQQKLVLMGTDIALNGGLATTDAGRNLLADQAYFSWINKDVVHGIGYAAVVEEINTQNNFKSNKTAASILAAAKAKHFDLWKQAKEDSVGIVKFGLPREPVPTVGSSPQPAPEPTASRPASGNAANTAGLNPSEGYLRAAAATQTLKL